MIYDEAIEFGMGKKDTLSYSNFFMFMKYSPNDRITLPRVKSKFYSHCYQTLIGWYHTQGNKWGCIWGHKKIKNWKSPTNGEVSDKQIVLENKITKETFIEKNSFKNKVKENVNKQNFLQIKSNMKENNKIKFKNNKKSQIKLDSSFKDHDEIVKKINSLNLGYTLKAYDHLKNKSIGELNKKYRKYNPLNEKNDFRFKSISEFNNFSSEAEQEEEEKFYNNFYFSITGKKEIILVFIFILIF